MNTEQQAQSIVDRLIAEISTDDDWTLLQMVAEQLRNRVWAHDTRHMLNPRTPKKLGTIRLGR